MIRQPQHPLSLAFEKARQWAEQQERQLTDTQRVDFERLKERQAYARQGQQKRLDALRGYIQRQDNERKPKPQLALKPPVLVADPYRRRAAAKIVTAEKRLHEMDEQHKTERVAALKAFEQERERRERAPDLSASWKSALMKAAEQEASRDQDRSRDASDSFDRTR